VKGVKSTENGRCIARSKGKSLGTFDTIEQAKAAYEAHLSSVAPKIVSGTERMRGFEYYLYRLRKDRPDLHSRVLAGELSAGAGMIEAGFRKSRPSKRKTPLQRVLRMIEKLFDEDRRQLRAALDAVDATATPMAVE
jgi:hypothetical protein